MVVMIKGLAVMIDCWSRPMTSDDHENLCPNIDGDKK